MIVVLAVFSASVSSSELWAQTTEYERFSVQMEFGYQVPSLVSNSGEIEMFHLGRVGAQVGFRGEFWYSGQRFVFSRLRVGNHRSDDMLGTLTGMLISSDEATIIESFGGPIYFNFNQFQAGYGILIKEGKYNHLILSSLGIANLNPAGDFFWRTKDLNSNYEKIHRLTDFTSDIGWSFDMEYAIKQRVYWTRYGNWEVIASIGGNIEKYRVIARYETLDILGAINKRLIQNEGVLATFRMGFGFRLCF